MVWGFLFHWNRKMKTFLPVGLTSNAKPSLSAIRVVFSPDFERSTFMLVNMITSFNYLAILQAKFGKGLPKLLPKVRPNL